MIKCNKIIYDIIYNIIYIYIYIYLYTLKKMTRGVAGGAPHPD